MLRKVILTVLAFIAFGLTKFAFNILVYRSFSPELLGEINQVLSLFLLVPLFYAPGLGTVVSKFAAEFLGAEQPGKSEQIFSFSLVVVVAASAAGTIIALMVLPLFGGSVEARAATVAALAPMVILYSLYTFLRSSYYGFNKVALYVRNELISSAVFFAVLATALATKSRLLVLLPFVSHGVVFTAIATGDLAGRFRFRALTSGISGDLKRWGHFFACTILITLAGPGAFHLGIVLTGHLTGDRTIVAKYSLLLYSLQPLNLVPIALATVLIPTISHHYGAGRIEKCVEVAREAFRALFLLMVAVWGLGAVLGWEAIAVISGSRSLDLLVAFEVILFAMYLALTTSPPSVLLNATKHISTIAVGGVVSAVFGLVAWLVLVPRLELVGAATGYGILQGMKALWAVGGAWYLLRWRGGLGIGAALSVAAVVAASAFALATERTLYHVAAAAALLIALLILNLGGLKQYWRQLVSELQSLADRIKAWTGE